MGWQPQDGYAPPDEQPPEGHPAAPFPVMGIVGIVVAALLLLFIVVANAGGGGGGGAAASNPSGAQSYTQPAMSALPNNVQSLLNGDWGSNQSLSSPDVTTADSVESIVGESSWIGSHSLPGTVTVGAPNAQGANVVTWKTGGQTFQWRISADGSSATALNANANAALSGSL